MPLQKNSRLAQTLLMILAAGAVFMDYLDTSIVSIALPEISTSFTVSSTATSWILTSYLLTLACTLLIFGKIADRTGKYKLIFTTGFILFTATSLLCGIAPSLTALITFRFIQGLAAALMVSTATSIISLHLPQNMQTLAAGIIATAGGAALAAGPAIGGLITEFISWHWIFYLNIPIGLLGILASTLLIPKDIPRTTPHTKFDITGAILFTTTLALLLTGLETGAQETWPTYSIIMIIVSLILSIIFIRHELRLNDPLIPAKLFRNTTIISAAISTLLVTLIYIGLLYILPFYFTGIGLSTGITGLIMIIPPLCLALIGIPSGALTIKFGCKKLCNIATLLLFTGMLLLAAGIATTNPSLIFTGLITTGIGNGLNEGPSIRRITVHSPKELQGSAGGLVFTVMNIGCVLGVALYSVTATAASASTQFTASGIAISCAVASAFALLAYITSKTAKDTIKS